MEMVILGKRKSTFTVFDLCALFFEAGNCARKYLDLRCHLAKSGSEHRAAKVDDTGSCLW